MSDSNVPLWGGGEALDLPRLEGERSADVCVVGLGGSGLACITALLDEGRTVIGIDAAAVASGAGIG